MMNINNAKRAKAEKRQKRRADPKVAIGSSVSLVDLSTGERLDLIVTASLQPGVRLDEVSSWSPLGKALLDRRVGESVYVEAPKGRVRYQILEIMERG
ncbi:MAG: GreA/GreB family elongation factor [bacterium]